MKIIKLVFLNIIVIQILFFGCKGEATKSDRHEDVIVLDTACFSVIKYETDQETKRTKATSKSIIFTSTKSSITFIKPDISQESMIISMVFDQQCIRRDGVVMFAFMDSTHVGTASNKEPNCEGIVYVFLLGPFGNKELFKSLLTKKLRAIRLYNPDGYIEQVVNNNQSQQFMNTINCMNKI